MKTINRSEPTFENQLWHARRLLAREGMRALENPHTATGKICGCGTCFCCAALAVANEAKAGQPKIYWRAIDSSIGVTLRGSEYVTKGGSLVYWHGNESAEAHSALGKAVQS